LEIGDIRPPYPYRVRWYLNNGSLYLGEIHFEVANGKLFSGKDNEEYRLMEKLTGRKFSKKYENHTQRFSGKEVRYPSCKQ
jgi:hypothetical protein